MTDDSRIRDIVYKRRNGENLVGDPQAIQSCKNEQSRDVIDNARLGSYDKFGNYVIIPDIKHELVSMPKLVYNVKNDGAKVIYELKGSIPLFGDLFFKLVFSGEEAVLNITETVNREANGYLEVYDEVVDSVAYGKNALPQDIIFRNYNVVEKPDDFGKNTGLYDFNNILTRKVYLNLLSKELKEVSKFDEHDAFNKMVATLKEGGEYGARVLKEFVNRLKERPGIFEITKSENYNKAVNEVLLSSLDLATTKEDKEEYSTRQTYLKVLNTRNENIEEYLEEANSRVDEKYVKHVVDKATENFQQDQEEQDETVEEFFDRIANKKSVPTKRKLEKAILKQGKGQEDEEAQTKEDKIKSILEKKEKDAKKTPAGKKLKPSKGKTASKKLKGDKKKSASKKAGGKKKGAKKKLGKGKVKSKKKKVKKAKSPQKAKAKAGGKLGGKAGGAKKAKKKKEKKSSIMTAYQKEDKFEDLIRFSSSTLKFDNEEEVERNFNQTKIEIKINNLDLHMKKEFINFNKQEQNENQVEVKAESTDQNLNRGNDHIAASRLINSEKLNEEPEQGVLRMPKAEQPLPQQNIVDSEEIIGRLFVKDIEKPIEQPLPTEQPVDTNIFNQAPPTE